VKQGSFVRDMWYSGRISPIDKIAMMGQWVAYPLANGLP